jgi:hypothetical protein
MVGLLDMYSNTGSPPSRLHRGPMYSGRPGVSLHACVYVDQRSARLRLRAAVLRVDRALRDPVSQGLSDQVRF